MADIKVSQEIWDVSPPCLRICCTWVSLFQTGSQLELFMFSEADDLATQVCNYIYIYTSLLDCQHYPERKESVKSYFASSWFSFCLFSFNNFATLDQRHLSFQNKTKHEISYSSKAFNETRTQFKPVSFFPYKSWNLKSRRRCRVESSTHDLC